MMEKANSSGQGRRVAQSCKDPPKYRAGDPNRRMKSARQKARSIEDPCELPSKTLGSSRLRGKTSHNRVALLIEVKLGPVLRFMQKGPLKM
jgi:hypothetical protein